MNLPIVINSFFFNQLYPDGLNLDNSFINKLEFDYNGPSIYVYFNTKKMPSIIPKKWNITDNIVQIVLEFIEIEIINFSGWGVKNKSSVQFIDSEEKFICSITGSEVDLKFYYKHIRINRISSYREE